jgi:DNA-binding PadR family transcriptional regulator
MSDLYILTILAAKGEAYPYEIQQVLYQDIFKRENLQIQVLEHLIDMGQSIVTTTLAPNKNGSAPDLEPFLSDLPSELHEYFIAFQNEISTKPDALSRFSELLAQGSKILEEERREQKIWDSKTAIYQVIGDLEREGLIHVSREEVQQGRHRKFYQLTDDGRVSALQGIAQLGQLYQTLLPRIQYFEDLNDIFLHDKMSQFIGDLFPVEVIGQLVQGEPISSGILNHLFSAAFPLLQDNFLLLSFVLGDFAPTNDLMTGTPQSAQQDIYKKAILGHLKSLQARLQSKIDQMESLLE